jgi:hypothetical protein
MMMLKFFESHVMTPDCGQIFGPKKVLSFYYGIINPFNLKPH